MYYKDTKNSYSINDIISDLTHQINKNFVIIKTIPIE